MQTDKSKNLTTALTSARHEITDNREGREMEGG
jgi:hypothetical protein